MARKSLEVGEIGKPGCKHIGGRKYRAHVRARLSKDKVVQVQAVAGTEKEALRLVIERAQEKIGYISNEGLSENSTVTELVEAYIKHMRAGVGVLNEIRPQTLDQYETVIRILKGESIGEKYPTIGDLPLRKCKTSHVHRWLGEVSMISPSTGKRCKVVLKHAFKFALTHDIDLWRSNPAAEAELKSPERKPVKALTAADIKILRKRVAEWQTPRKRTDLIGIVDMLIATGMRPNEALALRWEDIDLASTIPHVTVRGTLVEVAGGQGAGGGLIRQDMTKTRAGIRKIALPTWIIPGLMERRVMADGELVFPSEVGGYLSLRNIGNRWRDARGEDYKHVSLYDFRRTVATRIARKYGAAAAGGQLGHGDDGQVATEHYIEKELAIVDFSDALNDLVDDGQSV